MDIPKNNEQLKNQYFENKRTQFEDGCYASKSADACFSLGEWHQLIGKDETKAAEHYAPNCLEQNHPNSCFNLGMLLVKSDMKPPKQLASNKSNDELARDMFRRACELKEGGHQQGCSAYATLLLSGTGGSREVSEGLNILEKLCEAPSNDARACVRLGSAYLRGQVAYPGIAKDMGKAFSKMRRACDDLGHPNGCQVLAVMYAKGDGVERNDEMAEKYRRLTKELMTKTGEKIGTVPVKPS